MRIFVTGTQGQVVSALKRLGPASGVELIALGRPEVDLNALENLRAPILAAAPDLIISAAAYTQVDKAEAEPDQAMRINGEAPGVLAAIAAETDIPIIHLSTDYVFDGRKSTPYVEGDTTQPLNIYGQSKLAGEKAVMAATSNHLILRATWLYSPFGTNFVKTMLRLAETHDQVRVVDDQFGAPTSTLDIARALLLAARRLHDDKAQELRGLFHLSADGEASWADVAEAVFAEFETRRGKLVKVVRISSSDYPTAATRPANSRLNCEKFFSVYGLRLDPWRVSLQSCLEELIGKPRSGAEGAS